MDVEPYCAHGRQSRVASLPQWRFKKAAATIANGGKGQLQTVESASAFQLWTVAATVDVSGGEALIYELH